MTRPKSVGERMDELLAKGAVRVGESYRWKGRDFGTFKELEEAVAAEPPSDPAPAKSGIEVAGKKRLSRWISFPLAIIGGFSVLLIVAFSGKVPEQPADYKALAHLHCNEFVRDRLKSPSSADFPFADYMANKIDDRHYVIMSSFEAMNSFGVKLKNTYACNLQWNGTDASNRKNWQIISLTLE